MIKMAKIELDHNRIRRVNDVHDLSCLFFPQKAAHSLRASFIAILIEIKNNPDHKLADTAYIAREYGLTLPSVCKARSRMRKFGLIDYRDGYWQLSSRFHKALDTLSEKITNLGEPALTKEHIRKDRFMVELAKGVQHKS
jgi:hypothetical protein